MGQNATARLWYGLWNPSVEERVVLEVEEPASGDYEKVVNGVMIEFFYVYDNRVGLGGTVAHSWWAENEKPIDLLELARVKFAVDQFLDEYDVPGDRGFHLTADFS